MRNAFKGDGHLQVRHAALFCFTSVRIPSVASFNLQDMASSGNPPPPQDPTTADEYECLKYIIDTARTDTATTDVANKDAMLKVADLTKIFRPMSMKSLHLAGHYAYRYIAPLNYTLLHLRRRLRNLPEGFRVKSNSELNADRKDDVQVGDGWQGDEGSTKNMAAGRQCLMANTLVELIRERERKEGEVWYLMAELRYRMDRAAEQGWYPRELVIDLSRLSPGREAAEG